MLRQDLVLYELGVEGRVGHEIFLILGYSIDFNDLLEVLAGGGGCGGSLLKLFLLFLLLLDGFLVK